jgi:cysteine desulfurase
MPATPVYMDNHATTRVDPRVIEAMLPMFAEIYGNPGSTSHVFGWDAAEAVDAARESIASAIDAEPKEIIFTSGATESNNLAIRGLADRTRRRGNHIITVKTEHKAILDPLTKLGRRGFEITLLEVEPAGSPQAGLIDPQQVADAIRDDTLLVTVMLANNEIGAIPDLAAIGAVCRQRGVPLHTDATQAVGKIPVNVEELQVDLLSFSAHKMYGPKGTGALYVRRRDARVRLEPLIEGGGQERGLRSGTLNPPGIIGLGKALELCLAEMPQETERLRGLRERLFRGLTESIPDVTLNGPAFDPPHFRLPGNLNCSFAYVDGEALMMSMRDLAVSSGSACTSTNPEPSHVLRALGLSDDLTRSSLRFGLGRFNTGEDVDFAVHLLAETVPRLRKLSSMAPK